MAAASGTPLRVAHTFVEARQRRLWRLLVSHGVLTHEGLRELSHADGWAVPFDRVLERAVASGWVRRLSDDLYEAGADPLMSTADQRAVSRSMCAMPRR